MKFWHFIMCHLASPVQITQDHTGDFKVAVCGQFSSRIFAGGLAVTYT